MDRKGNLWTLANKAPLIEMQGLNPEEVNFSLYRVKPRDIIKGTVCGSVRRKNRSLVGSAIANESSDFDIRFDKKEEEKEKTEVVSEKRA